MITDPGNDESSLPEGWAVAALGQVTRDISYGYTAKAIDTNIGPKLLRITDIQDGAVDWNRVPFCEIDDHRFESYRLSTGDLVFARTGATTGKSFLIKTCPNSVFASYLIRVRPSAALLPEYVGAFFQTRNYWSQITENLSGSAQPNCNASKLASLVVPIAPLAEQRRIVGKLELLLGKVSSSQQRLSRVPGLLKRFRQSVLAAACSGKLTADWREENDAIETAAEFVLRVQDERRKKFVLETERAKTPGERKPKKRMNESSAHIDEPRNGSPSSWCTTRIGDVCECLDYMRIPVNKAARQTRRGSIPYYGANGQVGWIDTHLFDEDLVLVVEDESFIGREKPFSYVVRGKCWVNNHAHVLRPLGGMPADFLNICLAYYDFVPLTSGTTGRRKLNQEALVAAPLMIGPLTEQQEIVRRVEKLFAFADQIEARLRQAQAHVDLLTQSLLAKAFRGELVPTEHALAELEGRDYESASELLARIQATGAETENNGVKRRSVRRRAESKSR